MFPRVVGAFVAVALVGSAGVAQAAEPITLTAEAVEVVKLKPDVAKIYLSVESKDGSAEEAAKANADARKKLVDAVEKAGSKGLKTAALQQKITKDRDNSNRVFRAVGPGGPVMQPPPAESYTVNQPMMITVTETDPEKLLGAVEKVLQAAAAVGVTGDQRGSTDYGYSPYGETRLGGRVVYEVKGGWDAPVSDALAKATARAVKNAEALAKGAGLKVLRVQAVEDVSEGPVGQPDAGVRYYPGNEEPVSDGIELTRRVKVRVKVTAE